MYEVIAGKEVGKKYTKYTSAHRTQNEAEQVLQSLIARGYDGRVRKQDDGKVSGHITRTAWRTLGPTFWDQPLDGRKTYPGELHWA